MPDNNTLIMLGLGAAALFLWNNRGASEDAQTDQLTGAAMMAAGEGTAPNAPFQAYSAPANPVFFFNQGGEMAQIPGTNVPKGASTDEDIGVYPGGTNRPELEFEIQSFGDAIGTTDNSPINPVFQTSQLGAVEASTIWDQQALIANSNFMPLLAIQDTSGPIGGGIDVLGSNVNISNLSSKEQFRAVNLDTGFNFVTNSEVLGEYVQGFTGVGTNASSRIDNATVVTQTPINWWDEG
jgi:hypothetical protein|tara:strand:+ start:1841 stop:2554 length:714 start_codon:yes stop_codon:yes gene_type:complete